MKGEEHGQFTNMEVEPGLVAPGTHSGSAGMKQQPSKLSMGALLWIIFISLVAVTGFVLGCWATNEVRNLEHPPAYLVSKPSYVPPGYTVFPLGTGMGYWTKERDMLHGRSDHGVVSYKSKAYLIGGLTDGGVNGTGEVLTSLVQFDPYTDFMIELAPMPFPRYRFATALLGDVIYVMGGTQDAGDNAGPLEQNNVMAYSISTNTWEVLANLDVPRIDPCGGAINDKVYVFGGYNVSFGSLASVNEFDPVAKKWTLLPASSNLQVSRGDCRATVLGNRMYAVGGTEFFQAKDAQGNNVDCNSDDWIKCYRFLSSMEAFDPTTKTWSMRAPMITPRGDFGIDVLPNGRIFVAGGEYGNGTRNNFAMHSVEEYVVQDDIWVGKAPMPEARFRADCAAVSGRVYIFGGAPTCGLTPPGSNETQTCASLALSSVLGYFDVQHPNLYAFFRQDPSAEPWTAPQ